jgi:hypothetical protein
VKKRKNKKDETRRELVGIWWRREERRERVEEKEWSKYFD